MAKDISSMGYNLFVKEENRDKRFVAIDGGNGSRTNKAGYHLSLKGVMKQLFGIMKQAEWNRIAIDDYDSLPKQIYQVRNQKGEILWEETL